jgi:hypothetical protein
VLSLGILYLRTERLSHMMGKEKKKTN